MNLKVLNLYAGIGGNRKLWEDVEVTAVENNESIAKVYQDYYPVDKMIIGDAHQYLLDHFKEFDFIWSSPPCPSHSRMRLVNYYSGTSEMVYADMSLYQEIILLDNFFDGQYCIENVIPYYDPLIPARKSGRHLFWTNFNIGELKTNHISIKNISGITQDQRRNEHGFKHLNWHGYKGDKRTILKNCVDPRQGEYILNCAQNIITKSTHQTELF